MRQNKNKCRMIVDVKKYKLLAQVIENRMTLLFDRQFLF